MRKTLPLLLTITGLALTITIAGPTVHAQNTGQTAEDNEVPRYVLESIRIEGNRRTLNAVILRYIDIQPGEVFSGTDERLENARYRMLATGLFTSVQFELRRGSSPGHAVLLISVRERNTIVIRDLSFGLTRIAPYWDTITPWGSVGVANNSLLGSGVSLFASVAGGREQFAYNIGFRDDHIFNSDLGLRFEGLFVEGSEYFGEHYLPAPGEAESFDSYSQLEYRRAAIRFGGSYNRITSYSFSLDFRVENILAERPRIVDSNGDTGTGEDGASDGSPIGYLEPDSSILSGLVFSFVRDTRNSALLTSQGAFTWFTAEISHPIIGSSYEYTRFTIGNSVWFPFGTKVQQSICVSAETGLVVGNAPFFEQFFVGDYSAFIPNRNLGLNFTNLHPNLLNTSIKEMWYEDIVGSIGLTWNIALYRGEGVLYGIDGFVNAGLFALTSTDKIGSGGLPMDMTADLGVRFDTRVGLFTLSFGSIIQMIPPIYEGTTE